jgi:hypothetical protein
MAHKHNLYGVIFNKIKRPYSRGYIYRQTKRNYKGRKE